MRDDTRPFGLLKFGINKGKVLMKIDHFGRDY